MNILIVYANSGRGLEKDSRILAEALADMGHQCEFECLPPTQESQNRLSHYRYRLFKKYLPDAFGNLYYVCRTTISKAKIGPTKSDLVIHLENLRLSHLGRGHRHWLIPNQEWFIESRLPYLRGIDRILCKTRHATEIFSRYHTDASYLGFTGGPELTKPDLSGKNYQLALHVAGNSQFKGTKTVLDCWLRHPEWPKLVVVSQHLEASDYESQNIDVRRNLTDQEMEALWREAGFAIQPSEVEGYGQVLAEALANGCVTVSTDAPPMNELIENGRGYLADPGQSRTFRLGTRYITSPQSLEMTIDTALNATQDALECISANACQWYALSHDAFLEKLRVAVSDCTNHSPDQPVHESQENPTH